VTRWLVVGGEPFRESVRQAAACLRDHPPVEYADSLAAGLAKLEADPEIELVVVEDPTMTRATPAEVERLQARRPAADVFLVAETRAPSGELPGMPKDAMQRGRLPDLTSWLQHHAASPSARRHEQHRQPRAEQLLQTVRLLSSHVATTPKLAEALSFSVDVIQRRMEYEWVAAYLAESEASTITLCAVAGINPTEVPPAAYHLPLGAGTPGQAVLWGVCSRVTDFRDERRVQPALSPHERAELSVPIRDGEQILGALMVASTRGPAGLPENEELALLADVLAAAIRGANVVCREAERFQREILLIGISRALSTCLDIDSALQLAVNEVGNRFKADRCSISRIEADGRLLTTIYEHINPLLIERRRLPKAMKLADPLTLTSVLLQSGEVIISTMNCVHPALRPAWDLLSTRYDIQSVILVPIADPEGRTPYSLMLYQITHPRRWSPEETGLLLSIADQLALTLRNARLFRDVQLAADELRNKNAELESFAYSVSHDLQAPAVSLRGFASLLKSQYGDRLEEQGNLYLARIVANADFLSQMLQDLLELSRVSSSYEPMEQVAVGIVVEKALSDLARPIAERGVVVQLPAAWPVVSYSHMQLYQVFSNLLSNAVKFMGDQPEPRLEIDWRRVGEQIELTVSDNGIGFPPNYHERIFRVFQRLGQVDVEGTGVGLSIVKQVVERHGGRIRVESTPGAGASFSFTVPAWGGEAEEDAVQEGSDEGPEALDQGDRLADRGQPRSRLAHSIRAGDEPLREGSKADR